MNRYRPKPVERVIHDPDEVPEPELPPNRWRPVPPIDTRELMRQAFADDPEIGRVTAARTAAATAAEAVQALEVDRMPYGTRPEPKPLTGLSQLLGMHVVTDPTIPPGHIHLVNGVQHDAVILDDPWRATWDADPLEKLIERADRLRQQEQERTSRLKKWLGLGGSTA